MQAHLCLCYLRSGFVLHASGTTYSLSLIVLNHTIDVTSCSLYHVFSTIYSMFQIAIYY
ncbi:hypothetical protein DL96DRAFT_1578975, partial [Flagelloscypha sp. PMI_526]